MDLEGRRESKNVIDRRRRIGDHVNFVNSYWWKHKDTPWDNAADRINEEKFDPDKTDTHIPYEAEIEDSQRRKAMKQLKHELEPSSRQDNTRIHHHNWNE